MKIMDMGKLKKGDEIEVTISDGPANIYLMTDENRRLCEKGKAFKYIGSKMSPQIKKMLIPSDGHWHLGFDMRGMTGGTAVNVKFPKH